MAISPDSRWLVTGSATVRIDWNSTVPMITWVSVARDMEAPPINRHATTGNAIRSGAV
jgi:hypothetical protein